MSTRRMSKGSLTWTHTMISSVTRSVVPFYISRHTKKPTEEISSSAMNERKCTTLSQKHPKLRWKNVKVHSILQNYVQFARRLLEQAAPGLMIQVRRRHLF